MELNEFSYEQRDKQKKIVQLLVIIASVAVIVSCFMPFYTVSLLGFSKSVSYIDGDGVISVILAIAAIVLALLKLYKITLVPAAINLLMIMYDVSNASSVSEGMGSLAVGAVIAILGSIAVAAGGVMAIIWKLKKD